MKVAFHFNADSEKYEAGYGLPIQEAFFRLLLNSPIEDLHVRIFTGDLLVWKYLQAGKSKDDLLNGLLGFQWPIWRAIDFQEFARALSSANIYVLAVEGLAQKLAWHLHLQLQKDSSYIGAFQIYEASPAHWALYGNSLIPRYSLAGKNLRVFFCAFDKESRGTGLADHWKRLPFTSVEWEDLGAHFTIFDSYDSFEHAAKVVELEGFVSDHLTRVADEVLLRLGEIDPGLKEQLHAALKRFEISDSGDYLAQAATSCRRFLRLLADALYPPRDGLVDGRKLGAEEYRNRLWAYVNDRFRDKEKEGALVLAQLEDLGGRIDRLDRLASKAIHARIERSDLHRLIVALITVTYDVLLLG